MTPLNSRYVAAKQALFDRYYETSLNPEQREAVCSVNGPLLILAGAGSGKTTVLVNRIVFIVKYGNAYFSEYVPYDISESRVAELEAAVNEAKSALAELSELNEELSELREELSEARWRLGK